MIIVRDVFRLHFGKAREATAKMKEGARLLQTAGAPEPRLLTDVTGTYYTLVLETAHESLQSYEAFMSGMSDEAWQKWYAGFTPLVREGYREIMQVVE